MCNASTCAFAGRIARHDCSGDLCDVWCRREQRDAVQRSQAIGREGRVTSGDLVEHVLGHNKFVLGPFVVPPAMRQYLAGRPNEVRTGRCRR